MGKIYRAFLVAMVLIAVLSIGAVSASDISGPDNLTSDDGISLLSEDDYYGEDYPNDDDSDVNYTEDGGDEIVVSDNLDNIYYLDNDTVIARLRLEDDAGGSLEAYLGDPEYATLIASRPIIDGYGELRLVDFNFPEGEFVGTHYITFIYTGDVYYVEPYPTLMTIVDYEFIAPETAVLGQKVTYILDLHNSSVIDDITVSELVEDEDDGEWYCCNPVDYDIIYGRAEITFSALTMGLHNFNFNYQSNGYDIDRNVQIFVYPDISIKDNITIGVDSILTLKVPDDAFGTFSFSICSENPDDEQFFTADYEGETLSFSSARLNPGTYRILTFSIDDDEYGTTCFEESPLSIKGDEFYASFNATYPANVAITSNDFTATYSSNAVYKVKVTANGKIAKGAAVTFKINGAKVKTARADSNGYASLTITNAPGTYKLTVQSLGRSATKKLTVRHLVTLKSVSVKKSAKKLVLTASLSKINGKYLKNRKVTFKFNGKKFTAVKTDSKGVAKLTIKSSKYPSVFKKLKVGKKVTYQATYLKDTVKKSVKVKK